MSEIDAALKTRFQHIIEQENWIIPERTAVEQTSLQGGEVPRGFGLALVIVGIIILAGSIGGTCYLKYRK